MLARGVCPCPVADTARTVLDVAKEEGAGLIVMGNLGALGLGPALGGSVAHRVVHLADFPVPISL
jgi:nucleotide-binding universal stress UspA family protein